MKALQHSITITGRIEFTRRELQLLNNLFSYDNKALLSNTPNSYEGGVTREEMAKFIKDFHTEIKGVINKVDLLLENSKIEN